MKYHCDRCPAEHELDETKVKDKQHYIKPRSCFEGDFYVHLYFWFPCSCGRPIWVTEGHLSKPINVPKDYTAHDGVYTNPCLKVKKIAELNTETY